MTITVQAEADHIGVEPAVQARPVSIAIRLGYGLGMLGWVASVQVVGVFLIRYFTDNLGIPAAVAGGIYAAVQIYEAVLNPVVGVASDTTRSRWGRRKPYLLAGALILPLSVALLFNIPQALPLGRTILVATALLVLFGTGYTAWNVPYLAMAAEMTDGYHERSTLVSYRTYGFFIGTMLGSSLPAGLIATWGATRSGHGRMALVVGAISLACCLAGLALLRHARATQHATGLRYGWSKQLQLMWGNKPFRILSLGHLIFMIGVSTTTSSAAFFSRYILKRPDSWLATFYLILLVGNAVSIPGWLWLAKRIDKKAAYLTALVSYAVVNLSWLLAHASEPMLLLVLRSFAFGFTASGVILLGYSMVSDATRYDYIRCGLRREGAFAGVMSLIERFAASIGVAFMGVTLSAFGYKASTHGGVAQTPEALWSIYASFSILPAIVCLITWVIMLRYSLKESDLRDPAKIAITPAEVAA